MVEQGVHKSRGTVIIVFVIVISVAEADTGFCDTSIVLSLITSTIEDDCSFIALLVLIVLLLLLEITT